ncbi:glucose-6-phosphate dehydrogenase SCDLUD_003045 [Saccharomycodes ludwigii]|uniref:glucose-6-phosphate dehydrogenase n=1 Tax=Saccharomycodes ludwigii TaxID=36035 RepID=UPI001E8C142E|nr:hypothetical protein SCDLUD_003045 [Saccharomycodes ludwigii]KAH3901548.1 hypothetical protein SCDLUD_003045 [Saccharomycodes ludwigii]
MSHSVGKSPIKFEKNTVITVFGASGDLSKKKTFPALFGLYREGYLDESTKIFGYARSKLDDESLRSRIKPFLKKIHGDKDNEKVEKFLSKISYVSGQYDSDEGYQSLKGEIEKFEKGAQQPHRVYYLALPPSVFITVASRIKKNIYPENGVCRIVVEKPFGHDLESARELQEELAPLFPEDEIFRIDHYLGKEMVKNLLVFRFGNTVFNAGWNRENIKCIQLTFKEPFGTEGRGGYFDKIGIIRDVMQNHLLQILTLLTMERPVSFDPESVRDEKVKVLKAFAPINQKDIIIGQYGRSLDGTKPSYLDDETVSEGSKCITFAALTFNIQNERWDGVPIIMKAGKALNEGKVEIRIQFKAVPSGVFNDIPSNELVIRVQPDEAIYLKCNMKTPGFSNSTQITDLDLTYARRYQDFWIPEAYESLIRDVLLDDHSNFVRDDELEVSWALFTPLLNYLENPNGPAPEIYPYGTRGPSGLSKYLSKHGYIFEKRQDYQWPVTRPSKI